MMDYTKNASDFILACKHHAVTILVWLENAALKSEYWITAS